MESNHPSAGLRRPAGFEDRQADYQKRYFPAGSIEFPPRAMVRAMVALRCLRRSQKPFGGFPSGERAGLPRPAGFEDDGGLGA